jgi:hypothetical protein
VVTTSRSVPAAHDAPGCVCTKEKIPALEPCVPSPPTIFVTMVGP